MQTAMRSSAAISTSATKVTSKSGAQLRCLKSPLHASRSAVVGTQAKSLRLRCISAATAGVPPPREIEKLEFEAGQQFSGLNGTPLLTQEWPTKSEVLNSIPKHCFKRDTLKSMLYAGMSTALTLMCGAIGYFYIPMTMSYAAAWLAYGAITGTVATGCWVIAHECGHSAFSDNKTLQDTVGYVLHSLLLVPYFSWQRSHAVHHAKTNHLSEGETHVPHMCDAKGSSGSHKRKAIMGGPIYGALRLIVHLVFGWPAYLISGATGGPVRGKTNHFLPFMGSQGKHALFPRQWANKVYLSDVGIAAVVGGLCYWAHCTSWAQVGLLYALPYCFVNVWLVLYTWLQHTDVDIPHYDGDNWNFIKGALTTVDRPYGPVLNFLHHGIGRTHVAHHVNSAIPHYNAWEATDALKEAFPEHYLYDPTPIIPAMWRVATKCIAVEEKGDRWVFRN